MKLGWIVMPPAPAIHRHLELIADTYLSVSSPIQQAAPHWLAARHHFQAPIRERCLATLTALQQAITGTSWTLHLPQAGWVALLRGPASLDEESLCLHLIAHGHSVHPGFYYDLPFAPALVVSLLTPPATLASGLALITSA
jgi:DNA-binding transcriptional MocR family regulator